MKKNLRSRRSRSLAWLAGSGLLLVGAMLLTTSCAKDGYDDDERYTSSVTGSTLVSPEASSIKVTPSADGKSQTITWNVVKGAGGYYFSFYDLGDVNSPIVKDSLIDGCSVTVKREEDVNYRMDIRTAGNSKLNNTEASETTQYLFSTFTATYAKIPAGADLTEWFKANPCPADSIGKNLNYDLEGGAQYTVSGIVNFDANAVTLRSTSKTNHAKIKYTTEESTITFTADFNAKYLDFDCSGMAANKGVFAFSKETTVAAANTLDADTYKWTGPFFDKVVIASCNFDNVNGYFFWDNQVKTGVKTMLIDNCLVRLTPPASNSGGVIWTNKAGHINDFTVSESTFYEPDGWETDYKYFYQAGGVSAHEIYNSEATTNSVNYKNSTFYHIAWNNGQWGNYNRMQGRAWSYWVMTDCIFYDCSTSGSVPRRFLHGQAYASSPENKTFNNNTYMKADGTFQDPQSYDQSGTIIEEDPQFADPASGNFTISGPTQVARKTGDPRWLP